MFNHSMSFSVGEDNQTLRNTIYKFAQKEIAPLADKVDKENTFPNN
ncbi:MAG: isovaleryl-CoA dehydrogenase, partial [Alphaproteobacteria bacterium]|nr:isovaleryl-CoA dehydrogenase [Alphaproteobacteria bacterium]